jgi:3-deoxy-D-manno-octulosonate 8-phosphate phosphatase (KDO 8-P phosphatase)
MSYKQKLTKIKTFIFDVDGVLTDGGVYLFQDEVVRMLNSKDGYAIQYAAKLNYDIFVITGGNSVPVKDRLLGLGVKEVFLQSKNKKEVYEKLKNAYDLKDEEILYMGDDIPDFSVMELAGVAACPQDAAVEIKEIADYQSPYNGGKHCVRDVIEQTLRVQGKWFGEKSLEW